MPQSLVQIYLHVVFSTKHRTPFLSDQARRAAAHTHLSGTCHNLASPAIIIGGVADHVHIFCRLAKTWTVPDFVRALKRESSKRIKGQGPDLAAFYWQGGYRAFSVSPRELDTIATYIASQETHHATESFQDELRGLLAEYQVDYDERYVWD